jgi:hypothetical protein
MMVLLYEPNQGNLYDAAAGKMIPSSRNFGTMPSKFQTFEFFTKMVSDWAAVFLGAPKAE